MHFVRLATTLLKSEESAQDDLVLAKEAILVSGS